MSANEALRKAVARHEIEAVKSAIAGGADPNLKNALGTGSMLCMAAFDGVLPLVTALLDAGANPNLPDEAPLVLSLRERRFQIAELLLARGANPNHGAGSSKTALHNLIMFKPQPDVIAWLLERGADPNGRSASGETPLIAVAKQGLDELVAPLLAGGADANAANGHDTPLNIATYYRRDKMVALLTQAGARTQP